MKCRLRRRTAGGRLSTHRPLWHGYRGRNSRRRLGSGRRDRAVRRTPRGRDQTPVLSTSPRSVRRQPRTLTRAPTQAITGPHTHPLSSKTLRLEYSRGRSCKGNAGSSAGGQVVDAGKSSARPCSRFKRRRATLPHDRLDHRLEARNCTVQELGARERHRFRLGARSHHPSTVARLHLVASRLRPASVGC